MSGNPHDSEPEKAPDSLAPVDSAELEQDQFALDAYGIKTKFPLGEPDAEGETEIPPIRPWKAIRDECVASVQQLIVGLSQLPVVAIQQTIRVFKNAGRLSKGVADIAQRLAGGRSRVDHSEDEKIAEAAERKSLPAPSESQALAEKATSSLEARLEALRARGIPARIVQVRPNVFAIVLVAEEHQAAALDTIHKELPRLTQQPPASGPEDLVFRLPLNTVTKLSTRVVKCLERAEIRTLYDLCSRSVIDLLSIKGFGNSSLKEVQEALKQLSLSLRDD